MKKTKDIFGTIFLLILICFMFGTEKTFGPKKSNRKYWIFGAVILAALIHIGYTTYDILYPYQDCVPATLQRIFPQVTIPQMRHLCHTERDGTYITNVAWAWYTLTTNKLDFAYNRGDMEEDVTNRVALSLDKTYLWVGNLNGLGHCALVKFYPTNAILSNSQFIPGTTNYYLLYMDYVTFFSVTDLVLTSDEIKDTIRFK